MSSTDTDYLIRDNTTANPTNPKTKKFIWITVIFLLGIAIGSVPSIILLKRGSHNGPNPPTPEPWNESDYQSNSDYYNQLTTIQDFNQTHNLRLDRLSSP